MTLDQLRDHFAGLALQGLLAGEMPGTQIPEVEYNQYCITCAECSYRLADAMITVKLRGIYDKTS